MIVDGTLKDVLLWFGWSAPVYKILTYHLVCKETVGKRSLHKANKLQSSMWKENITRTNTIQIDYEGNWPQK